MKYLVLADLHLDFWLDISVDPFAGLVDQMAEIDLLLLAGDITNKPKVRWPVAFRHLATYVSPERIAVIPGNHDFYEFRLDGEDRLAEIAADHGVRYVNDREVRLGDIRFLCATLWTDMALTPATDPHGDEIRRRMNDYRLIRVAADGYRRIRPVDTARRHRAHLRWLEERLAMDHPGRTMVVTHHVPVPQVLGKDRGALAAAYASDLSSFIERTRPAAWFYGHSHGGTDLDLWGCQIRNVSLGYPGRRYANPGARIASLIQTV